MYVQHMQQYSTVQYLSICTVSTARSRSQHSMHGKKGLEGVGGRVEEGGSVIVMMLTFRVQRRCYMYMYLHVFLNNALYSFFKP